MASGGFGLQPRSRHAAVVRSSFGGIGVEPADRSIPAGCIVGLSSDIGKKVMVILRDGKTFIGVLETVDLFANVVLSQTVERIWWKNMYGDIMRGVVLVRGDNIEMLGEMEEEGSRKSCGLIQVSGEEILNLQRKENEENQRILVAKE